MNRAVLCLDRRLEDRLILELLDAGHEVLARVQTAPEIVSFVAAERPDVVLVSAARLGQEVLTACDDAGARVLAFVADDAERRRLAQLGFWEVIPTDAPWGDIEAVLDGSAPFTAPGGAPSESACRESGARGSATVVWGPAGAPGRTTLAINIAAELAAAGGSVALLDADCYGGTVAPALGLLDESPGFAAACRLAGNDSLTLDELERVAQRHGPDSSRLRVLTGITRASRWPELSEQRVASTIEACRGWVDHVVVDTAFCIESDEEISSDLFAPRRNAATIAALGAADRIVVVGRADPVGVTRLLRGHAELAELGHHRVDVVLNRVRSSATGMAPRAQLTAALARFGGFEPDALLPDDPAAVDAAALVGDTLVQAAPRSPLRQAIAAYVESAFLAQQRPATRREARPQRGRRAAVRAAG
jgi:MinD-like ATPase involved in chromosome partitioning or flagellar assembly